MRFLSPLGLLPAGLLVMAASLCACAPGPERPKDLLLIVVDTLRADHLGAYGYHRPTSPNLDALAASGSLFEQAHSTAAYTRPSTGSMLTGHYPAVHGAITHADQLSPDLPTLAQRLQGGGYRTFGFYRNGNVGARWGFDRGFETYVAAEKRYRQERRRERRRQNGEKGIELASWNGDWQVTAELIPLLRELATARGTGDGRPFFLYLHLADPHDPYTPPDAFKHRFLERPLQPALEGFYRQPMAMRREQASVLRQLTRGELPWQDSTLDQITALYDSEIASSDHEIGRILAELSSLGLDESLVTVVTSDHGEELFERGNSGHGHNHFQEQIRVPLIVDGPDVKALRITEPVSLIDLAPTLLDFAGHDHSDLPGRSLRPALKGRPTEPRPLYSEGLLRRTNTKDPIFFRTVRVGDEKLTLDFQHHRKLFIDLNEDPEEMSHSDFGFGELGHSLSSPLEPQGRSSGHAPAARAISDGRLLEALLDQHHQNLASPALGAVSAAAIDEQTESELRALGYIGNAADSEMTDSLFRRPLRAMDLDPYGFLGFEKNGKRYLSAVDFSARLWSEEQLLYGWRLGGAKILMRRRAGIRLKRDGQRRWRAVGKVQPARNGVAPSIELTVTVDGQPGPRVELEAREEFVLSGPLADSSRGFTRLDFRCQASDRQRPTNPDAWCASPLFVGLE